MANREQASGTSIRTAHPDRARAEHASKKRLGAMTGVPQNPFYGFWGGRSGIPKTRSVDSGVIGGSRRRSTQRIDRAAVLTDFVVQVRPRTVARAAHLSDHLLPRDALAGLDQDLREVS